MLGFKETTEEKTAIKRMTRIMLNLCSIEVNNLQSPSYALFFSDSEFFLLALEVKHNQ